MWQIFFSKILCILVPFCCSIFKKEGNNTERKTVYLLLWELSNQPLFSIGDLVHLHQGSLTLSSAGGLKSEPHPLKLGLAAVCWYWATEQTCVAVRRGAGVASISAKRIRNQLLGGRRQAHVAASNKPSPYHHSFILPPLPPLALFLFVVSVMRISGCCRDLVLSVTARSTLIIHFGIFGILFFPPSRPLFLLCPWPEKAVLKYKKRIDSVWDDNMEGNSMKTSTTFYHLIHVNFGD